MLGTCHTDVIPTLETILRVNFGELIMQFLENLAALLLMIAEPIPP